MDNNFNNQGMGPENNSNPYSDNPQNQYLNQQEVYPNNQYGQQDYQQNNVYQNYPQSTSYYDGGQNNDFGTVVSGVDKAPKKKTGLIVGGICAGVVAVGVGGGAAAYAASDYVKNQVKLTTLNDQEYYSWVIEKNGEDMSEEIGESYKDYIEKLEDGMGGKFSVAFKPADEAKELLLTEMLGSDYKKASDDETQQLVNVIENVNTLEFGMDFSRKNAASKGSVYGALNDDRLLSFEGGMDKKNIYFRIPEVNEKWLAINISDTLSEVTGDEMFDKLMDYSTNPKSLITPEDLEGMIEKYTAILGENIKGMKRYKDQTVEIAGAKVEYTVLTANLTPKDAVKLAEKYVSAAAKDKTIKNLLVNKLEVCSKEDYSELFEEMLDELKDTRDSVKDNEDALAVALFVDARGDIRGIQLYAEDSLEMKMAVGLDKDGQVVGEFSAGDGSESFFDIELNAKEDGGKYSGEINIDIDNEQAKVKFANFEIVDDEKGYVNGKIRVSIPDVADLDFKLSSDGKSQSLAYNIEIEGQEYGTVVLTYGEKDSSDISFKNAVKVDEDFEIDEYLDEDKLVEFIEDICKKIGFDEDFAEEIADMASDEISGEFGGFGSSSGETVYDPYDFGIDEDDDYDFDDDDFDLDDEDDYEIDDEELEALLAELEGLDDIF